MLLYLPLMWVLNDMFVIFKVSSLRTLVSQVVTVVAIAVVGVVEMFSMEKI